MLANQVRLRAHAWVADGGWLAREDFQLGIFSLGFASEDVGIYNGQILLREGVGGDWACQNGGGS
jgi:hypothetical protein